MEKLQNYYEEHAEQARQHEDQRERVTNIILSIAGVLVGLITFSELSPWALPASASLVILGIFGFLFAGKHYERFKFHTSVMREIRNDIDCVTKDSNQKPRALSEIRGAAEKSHYESFRWPSFSGSNSQKQQSAISWIARQRVHVFWEMIHLIIAGLGLALCTAILIKVYLPDEKKPIKVEIVNPGLVPNTATSGTRKTVSRQQTVINEVDGVDCYTDFSRQASSLDGALRNRGNRS